MYQIQLINMVRSWERRLEIENEKRDSLCCQSNSNSSVAPLSPEKALLSETVWCPEPAPAQ